MKKYSIKLLFMFTLFSLSLVTYANEGAYRIFESVVSKYLFTQTTAGKEILSKVIGMESERVTQTSFRSFLQRMQWEENQMLRGELYERIIKVEDDFSAYRDGKGRKGRSDSENILLKDEMEFLANAAKELRNNRIENLLFERETLLVVEKTPYIKAKADFMNTSGKAISEAGGTIPLLPTRDSSAINLKAAKMRWHEQITMRFRAYRNFFKTFQLADGEWKVLFELNGKAFTPRDLMIIRKYNRLLDGLNEYAKMRLMIRSFANENPALYTTLNEITVEETAKFINGETNIETYIAARKVAAGSQSLQLNDIVWEAEKRMLTSIEKCSELGGSSVRKGLLKISEENMIAYQKNIGSLSLEIKLVDKRIALKKTEIKEASLAPIKTKLNEELRELELLNKKNIADKDLWRGRLDNEAKNLIRIYYDFVENYDSLELFANLRQGRINSEEVQVFNMPDPFILNPGQLKVWQEIYERALYNSTNELVLNETKLFFRTRIGQTRGFVRDMNKLTEKYFNKRFTDTVFGKEFYQFQQHIVYTAVRRLGLFFGLTAGTTEVAKFIDDHVAKPLWKNIFDSDPPEVGGETKSEEPSIR